MSLAFSSVAYANGIKAAEPNVNAFETIHDHIYEGESEMMEGFLCEMCGGGMSYLVMDIYTETGVWLGRVEGWYCLACF